MKAWSIALFLALALPIFGQEKAALPDPKLTPGATVPGITVEMLVQPGYAAKARHVTATEKRRVLALYHIADASGVVIDHLIPLALGGSNSLENLWPQPSAEAKLKDKVEDRMFHLVRKIYKKQGTEAAVVLLGKFQKTIANNWRAQADQ